MDLKPFTLIYNQNLAHTRNNKYRFAIIKTSERKKKKKSHIPCDERGKEREQLSCSRDR